MYKGLLSGQSSYTSWKDYGNHHVRLTFRVARITKAEFTRGNPESVQVLRPVAQGPV